MQRYILVHIEELPHSASDMDDLALSLQQLLTATGIESEVTAISAYELGQRFQDEDEDPEGDEEDPEDDELEDEPDLS